MASSTARQNLERGFETGIQDTTITGKHSSAATHVFDIAELLEMILEYADIPVIMTVMQLSRNIKAIVESSKAVKMLPLEPNYQISKVQYPFESSVSALRSGFSCLKWGRETHAMLYLNQNKRQPSIGSMYKSMVICQPPPTKMRAHIACSNGSKVKRFGYPFAHSISTSYLTVGTISSMEGIRIGDLYDSALEMTPKYEHMKSDHHIPNTLRNKAEERAEGGWLLLFVAALL